MEKPIERAFLELLEREAARRKVPQKESMSAYLHAVASARNPKNPKDEAYSLLRIAENELVGAGYGPKEVQAYVSSIRSKTELWPSRAALERERAQLQADIAETKKELEKIEEALKTRDLPLISKDLYLSKKIGFMEKLREYEKRLEVLG